MPAEIELKLRIAQADIPRLRRHPLIRQYKTGRAVTRRLISIYYDTPALDLLNADISLRVRNMSGGWFQSIKTAGKASDGLHSRMEWEDLLQHGEPDFDKITEPGLVKLFSSAVLRKSLKPIFTTDLKRSEWQLQIAQDHIEMALDVGCLTIDGVSKARICELELELKSGDASQLFSFAEQLKKSIVLSAEDTSKAELGYAFYMKNENTPGERK